MGFSLAKKRWERDERHTPGLRRVSAFERSPWEPLGVIIVGVERVFVLPQLLSIAQVVYELSGREMRGSRGLGLTKIWSLDLGGLSDNCGRRGAIFLPQLFV